MDLLLEAIGWLGAALLLTGYALVSSARVHGDGLLYQLINLGGAVGLMVNSAYNDAWPSAGLNLVWASIGVVALVKLMRLARSARADGTGDSAPALNE
ncbi:MULTISPECIES: CBU_0592 family membrane protein [Nonomuraea]|uniref:CBU-0592-like domain-containing protein n=1 Tax=Nonomuraea ferruginea TaxID=46174 RepID=A0ABT4SWI0_9ACTN|nr:MULTISPECIES: hypothetical protein [Nonomuraea]MDA0641470.1 hypothetical protein [Nonomuraea ferruginea]TXK42089.1 hypothetical protein FR742_23220 [Nonomuraea sp. C10]